MTEQPAWLVGILKKRSLKALQILLQLIEAGLRNGQCSPNDIHIPLTKEEHNVVGATFKILPRFGFQQSNQRIKPRKAKSNGRKVYLWLLIDPAKARQYIAVLTKDVRASEELEARITETQTVMEV